MERLLIVIAVVVMLTFAGMFLPRAEVSLEPLGKLPFSVGAGIAYAEAYRQFSLMAGFRNKK